MVNGSIIQSGKNISNTQSFFTSEDLNNMFNIISIRPPNLDSGSSITLVDIGITWLTSAVPDNYELKKQTSYYNLYAESAIPENMCIVVTGNNSSKIFAINLVWSGMIADRDLTIRLRTFRCTLDILYLDLINFDSIDDAPLHLKNFGSTKSTWTSFDIYNFRMEYSRHEYEQLSRFPIIFAMHL